MKKIASLAVAAATLAVGITPALAQMERAPSTYDRGNERTHEPSRGELYQGMRTTPAERRQGNATFVTGGVGKEESEAFRAMAPRYALSVEFARANAPRGDFLADVDVDVTDARGRSMLKTIADGPFLLANLPPGTYTVRAATNGRMKTQTVNIAPGGHQHVTFAW